MAIIEGATNPQILSHSSYESCRFVDVTIEFEFENPVFECVIFEHCEFVNCRVSRALWYKCSWESSYIINLTMTKTILALCKLTGLMGYSNIEGTVAIDSRIDLQQTNSKVDITYI